MLKSFRSNLLLLELNVIVTLLWLKRLSTVTINFYFFIKTLSFVKISTFPVEKSYFT